MKTKSKKIKKSVRLIDHVRPVHYAVTLKPDLEAHRYEGEETITIKVTKPTKTITLHSKGLEILSATRPKGSVAKVTYNQKLETATFAFPTVFTAGTHTVHIVFRGILTDDMRGFYKSRYVVDGTERFMAATQFEATDARRAIPCFDEPAHKAVFEVHLVIPSDKMAISNTLPVAVRDHEAGYKIVSFAPTPKMSTYLLAFIVGDFEWLEQKTKRGVLVRVLTVPGKSHQGKFALDVAVRCLEFYEKYFAIPYPLDTLDMIALPDFSSAAMENWGAVTYREAYLLVDDATSSIATREIVAEVIAHELAHQWFGNLVTMEWWTHLWLNEGFASYIPYLALDHLFPEWNIWEQFVPQTFGNTLRLDALRHTHPIEIDVHDPNEIGAIFDAVSYSKGATVIRMLAEYIGEKDFRDGLRHYLNKHSYTNASTVHLWDAFEKISKKPVKKMMAIWTSKPGYPLVEASIKKGKLALLQRRYYSSMTSRGASSDRTVWPLPMSVITPHGEKQIALMNAKTLAVPEPREPWFKLNARETAICRVRYSPDILQMLEKPIAEGRLSATDRLGIIRDLFSLAEAGELSTTQGLSMLAHYAGETEYIVWLEIVSGLRYITNLLYGTPAYEPARAYARAILAGAVDHIGWEPRTNETHSDVLMRVLILSAASAYGDERVIAEALRRFKKRKDEPILGDLRGFVYASVARSGGEQEYKTLLSMYRKETSHEEKNRLLGALGQFKEQKLLQQTLSFVMSDEVRLQDKVSGFAVIMATPRSRALGWKFVRKNWTKIAQMYGGGANFLSNLISVLNRHTTREAYREIKAFFKKNKVPSATRTIDQTLEHIDSNIRWLARDGKAIAAWFAAQNKRS